MTRADSDEQIGECFVETRPSFPANGPLERIAAANDCFASTERFAVDTLSVLIPAYNEERTIRQVVEQVLALGPVVHEVIVVDDCSTDGSAGDLAELVAGENRLQVIRQAANSGKTAAIRRAAELATGDILVIQDADMEYDPADIPALVAPILEGQADVVYGSRFMVRQTSRVHFFYHYLANRLLTFLSNVCTNRNMSDVETGYKAFRSCVLKPLVLTSSRFGMEIEITALICRTNTRIHEVPISYNGRNYSEGKNIQLRDGIAALWYIFYYNLVVPWLPKGRTYVRTVNASLRKADSQIDC